MKFKTTLLAAAYSLIATAAPIEKRFPPNPNLAVALPLYSWPIDGAWDLTYEVISKNPGTQFNVIINPDSGPGEYPPRSDYVSAVDKLHSYPNTNVYGYLRTGFTDRPIADVQDDVRNYNQWNSHQGADIHLDGIFVDEAPDSVQHLTYMKSVHAAIRSTLPSSAKIWTNPGCIVDKLFYEFADTVTAFESDFDYWMSPDREAIPWDLHDRTSVMIMNYAGQSAGPAEQARILIERGFHSGFLWGQEGYQEHSPAWQSFAESLADDERNRSY